MSVSDDPIMIGKRIPRYTKPCPDAADQARSQSKFRLPSFVLSGTVLFGLTLTGCDGRTETTPSQSLAPLDSQSEQVADSTEMPVTPKKQIEAKPMLPPASKPPASDTPTDATLRETEKTGGDKSESPASTQSVSISDPLTPEEMEGPLDDYVMPEEIAAKAFQPPPNAIQLSPANLWIDRKLKRVYADGYVAMRDGPLEMFACPVGTKEHESVVASIAKAKEIHAGLLAIGAVPGKPVQFRPEFVPASGQRIRVWICYLDPNDDFQVVDGRSWVKRMGKEESLEHEWVFAGSKLWTDPSDGIAYYQADGGDMICVSNFGSALMDIQVESSANQGALQFEPYTSRIPEPQTPVRIVMVPIDEDADSDEKMPAPPQRDSVFPAK